MKRYFWILMTYLTRPLVWMLSLVAIVLFVAAIVSWSDKHFSVELQIINADLPIIESRSVLDEYAGKTDRVQIRLSRVLSGEHDLLVKEKRSAKPGQPVHITSEELTSMTDGVKKDIKFPEHVVALSTGGYGPDFLPEISELTSLKRLDFAFSYAGDPLDVSLLKSLKNLEMLELGAIHQMRSLLPLSELPKLHTLKLGHTGVITKERMAEIAHLPALKHLYLPNVSRSDQYLDAIAELERSSSLECIYAEFPLSEPDILARIQSRVPHINVRSSRYRMYRLLVFGVMIWFSLLVSVLANHFIGQFSMPQAQLIPGYRGMHLRFSWFLIGSIVLAVSMIVTLLTGALFFPVFSAFGFAMAGILFASTRRSPLEPQPGQLLILRFILIGVFVAVVISLFRERMLVEEFLMGQWPGVAAAFLVMAIVFALMASWQLYGICRNRYATGIPLTLSMPDFQKAAAEVSMKGKEGAAGQTNPTMKFESLARNLGLVAVGLVVARFVWGDQLFGTRGVGAMLKGQVVAYCIVFCVLVVGLIGAKWWQRMPYLANLITRPPNRPAQIDALLKGIRNDFLCQLPPIALAVLILAVNAPFWSTDDLMLRTLVSAFFIISALFVCYAAILWGLIVRTLIGLIALGFTMQFGVPYIAVRMTVLGVDSQTGLPPYRVAITSLVMIGLASGGIWFAKKRFAKFEWGRLL